MLKFESIRYKNFLSSGNHFIEIPLNNNKSTLIVGENGSGKCVRGSTEIVIDFLDDDVKLAFEQFMKTRNFNDQVSE